ncbi:hypothetical protein BJV78DRAFT_1279551 [Lactifluus subvellereus]|nr:hypothetical protein BJV78DRAFT_1279551 [Lactifluus subvellereus]
MSPQNIVPVSGLNDISEGALSTATSLIRTAKNVKIYRSQCDDLSRRCLDLVSALRDHSRGLEGTYAQQVADEVEHVLTRILERVRKWADLGKMKSFVQQTEIRLGLDESYRELQSCSMRFNIALHLYASARSKELEEIRKRDHDELMEMITRVLHDKSLLKIVLAGETPEDAKGVELKEADVGETQERQLQEDFGELRRWVERLPPMDDLSGKVVLTSKHAVVTGGSQDIYTGELTGQEVILAYPRDQTRAAQERFRRQVEIWRTLRHPNILPLLGITHIDDFVYSVSPYMEFGNAIRYLRDRPEADRVLLLSEVASATEYLHMHGIIHGDLQGSNILISGDGHACLGAFGSARVEEVPVTDVLTHGGPRWFAPELMADSSYAPTTRATDVWSFGMLCIEIFTDDVPFSHITNDMFIPVVIRDGSLPTRPEHNAVARGLSDAMWDLMNQCWKRDPTSRPSMTKIREAIQNMHPLRSSSRGRSSSSISQPGNHHNVSSTSSAAHVSGGGRPSFLTISRPSKSTGLTPPSAPLPLPNPSAHDRGSWLEQSSRGPSPASFPLLRSPILEDKPLNSSPPSQAGMSPKDPRSAPTKPIPSLSSPSPLSLGSEPEQSFRGPSPVSLPFKSPIFKDQPLSSSPPSQAGLPSRDPLLASTKPIPSPSKPSPLSSRSQNPHLSPKPESLTSVSPPSDPLDWPFNPHPPLLLREPSTFSHANSSLLLDPIDLTSSHADQLDRAGSTPTLLVIGTDDLPTTNSPSSLLDAAVRDAQNVLRRSADGTVEAGTLEGLVDRLLKETHDRAKDEDVKRVFLSTYHLFTTDENLFGILKRRFEGLGDSDAPSLSAPGSIRYSTLLFLRTWLQGEGENMGRELLTSIRQFARSVGGSEIMNKVAQEIVNLVDEKMNAVTTPPTQSSRLSYGIGSPLSPEKIKAVDIAISLSVIEGDYYSKITQADYIAHLRGAPITNHIECATKLNNRLVSWVKKKILGPEDVQKRASTFQRFVQAAEECRKLQNFSSMSAIITALQSATLAFSTTSLILTRETRLSRSEKQLLRQLEEILEPLGDHRNYREALQNIKPPFAIPWLAFHLRSLQTFYDRSNAVPVLAAAGAHRRIAAIPRVARLDGEAPRVARARVGEKELENSPSNISREQFEARVAELAEKEHRMRESHELELISLGFKPPSRQRTSSSSHQHQRTSSSGSGSSTRSRMASPETRLGKI